MRIAAFSDWRVQPFEPLIAWLRKVKPDIILYAGDDTSRLEGLSEHAIIKIAESVEEEEEILNALSSVDKMIVGKDTTLKKFKQDQKGVELIRRISPDSQTEIERIWFGPPTRKRGICIYYERSEPSWLNIISSLSKHGFGAVLGNDCQWFDRYRLEDDKHYNLHEEPLIIDDFAVLGLEGSPLDIGFLLYEEEDAREHLDSQYQQTTEAKKRILVTHAPPKGVLDLSRRFDIHHIGSQAVRDFIEERDINLVICGHSHINGGRVEKIGDCSVLNIASHDYYGAPGKVALIEMGENGDCEITTDILYDSDSVLYQLHKLGGTRIRALENLGIDSLEKINKKNRKKMLTIKGVGDTLITKWIIEVKLLKEGRVARITDSIWNEIDLQKCLVYDIETDIRQERIWSIGAYTSDDGEYTHFFEKDEEKKLLNDFFEFVKKHEHLRPYTYSSTDFDLRVIKSVSRKHNLTPPEFLSHGIDVGWLTVHRTLGTPKGGLKTIAPFFGFEWKISGMDGVQAGMLYSRYLRSGEEADWDSLVQYNRDDVLATYRVLEKLIELEEISFYPLEVLK